MSLQRSLLLIALASLTACAALPEEPLFTLQGWGTMREVLREGKSQGRVHLSDAVKEGTWGVGALADLKGEITVVDGAISLASVEDGTLVHLKPNPGQRATLLVLATVDAWKARDLPSARTLADLEAFLGRAVREAGYDPAQAPVPLRIEGEFERVALHVIDGSCPIANPQGNPPWRWSGEAVRGVVVGVYAEGQAGVLTHHARDSHLHAVLHTADGLKVSGHVDELALGDDVSLLLPATSGESLGGRVEAVEVR